MSEADKAYDFVLDGIPRRKYAPHHWYVTLYFLSLRLFATTRKRLRWVRIMKAAWDNAKEFE